MIMYDNEFETMENKIWTKDKIEPQHIQYVKVHEPSSTNRESRWNFLYNLSSFFMM